MKTTPYFDLYSRLQDECEEITVVFVRNGRIRADVFKIEPRYYVAVVETRDGGHYSSTGTDLGRVVCSMENAFGHGTFLESDVV
jgi:hypothetical protein